MDPHGPVARVRRLDVDILHIVGVVSRTARGRPATNEVVAHVGGATVRGNHHEIQIVDERGTRPRRGRGVAPHQRDLQRSAA